MGDISNRGCRASLGFTPLERSIVLPWFYYHGFITMVLPWFDPISWIYLSDIVPFGQMLSGCWLVNYSIGMIINHYFLWCKLLVIYGNILCLMVMIILLASYINKATTYHQYVYPIGWFSWGQPSMNQPVLRAPSRWKVSHCNKKNIDSANPRDSELNPKYHQLLQAIVNYSKL